MGTFGKWVVYGTAIAFLGFGFAFYFWPGELLAYVSIALDAGMSRTEIRAVYGGMNTGIGLAVLSLVWRGHVVPAAALSTAVLVPILAGRCLGLAFDGSAGPEIFKLMALEGAGALLNALVWALSPGAAPGAVADGLASDRRT